MRTRSWRWLRSRIVMVLAIPPGFTPDGRVIQSTRLGHALYPPVEPKPEG